jgi:hypothetical protein
VEVWTRCPHILGPRLRLKKPTRRGRVLMNEGFSLFGPILPTTSVWRFCASETLQQRSGNASVTLQKRSTSAGTSGLHMFFDVFIHHRRFHGQWARCCGALLARVRACLAAARVRQLTPDTAPKLGTPCLKFVWLLIHTKN